MAIVLCTCKKGLRGVSVCLRHRVHLLLSRCRQAPPSPSDGSGSGWASARDIKRRGSLQALYLLQYVRELGLIVVYWF
jgi:hypothetical protein